MGDCALKYIGGFLIGAALGVLIEGVFLAAPPETKVVPVVKQGAPKQDFLVGGQVCTWDKVKDAFTCKKMDAP